MKRYITYAICLLLGIFSLQAQMGSKKSAIECTDDNQSYTLGDVYSVKGHKQVAPQYIVSKSDVQIPISYELYTLTKTPLTPNAPGFPELGAMIGKDYQKYSGEGITLNHTFNVFTIIDTNNLIAEGENTEEKVKLTPESKAYLPKNFNPYKGMFIDKIDSKYLLHPVTAR